MPTRRSSVIEPVEIRATLVTHDQADRIVDRTATPRGKRAPQKNTSEKNQTPAKKKTVKNPEKVLSEDEEMLSAEEASDCDRNGINLCKKTYKK